MCKMYIERDLLEKLEKEDIIELFMKLQKVYESAQNLISKYEEILNSK